MGEKSGVRAANFGSRRIGGIEKIDELHKGRMSADRKRDALIKLHRKEGEFTGRERYLT